LAKAAKGVKKNFENLDSSKRAEALAINDYQVQPIYLEKSQPKTGTIWQGVDKSVNMRQQLDEINGRVAFDELEKYHCATYNTLMKTVTPLRTAFR
jgi:hypothetical protein|tara:strand:+ start:15 stop:302 length:288 start_codon:yes stop_codon:yes gene_type:complete